MSTCLPQIRTLIKDSGKKVSEPVIREMHEKMQTLVEQGVTAKEFREQMKTLISDEMVARASAVKLSKLKALATYESVTASAIKNKALGISAFEHLRSLMDGGALKSGDGLNRSAHGIEMTINARLMTMFNQLGEIADEVKSGKIDVEIAQEKAALQGEGKAGESKNSSAKRAAEIFHAIQRTMFDMKKAANPLMGFNDRYYFEATHSQEKIGAVSKQDWVAAILETHGKETFPDLSGEAKLAKLGAIYDSITSGAYSSEMGGGGNIMFSMAKGRTLVPNDWQSFIKYHQRFGEGTISEVMFASMKNGAREISKLEKFGPEYRKFFDESYKRAYAVADAKDRVELEKKKQVLANTFKTVVGDISAPAMGMQAKLVQGLMSWENMALNGNPVIASMPDFALSLGLMRDITGKTQLEISRDFIANAVASATSPKQAREIGGRLGLFFESYAALLMRELGSSQKPVGLANKADRALKSMSELQGKLTGMHLYLEKNRSAIGITLGNYLADMAETAHASLPPESQRGLLRYGIGENEWSALKFATEKVDFNGREIKLLTPEAAMAMPDEVVENLLRKNGSYVSEKTPSKAILDAGRQELAGKIGSLINEHADLGTSTAGARQRTFMYRGLSINDGMGQVLRMIGQFKSAGLVSTDVMRRRYYSGADLKGAWAGVAVTSVQLFLLAGLANYANDALYGRKPQDPRDPEFILKTITRSGLGGPWGDVFLGELNRNGVDQMMLSSFGAAAGPVISKGLEGALLAAQTAKTAYQNNVDGKHGKYPVTRAFKWGVSQIPGLNLPMVKGAVNYYFLNGMRESLDHGYSRQLQKKHDYFMFDPANR